MVQTLGLALFVHDLTTLVMLLIMQHVMQIVKRSLSSSFAE
jgi:hypothetical protein